MSEVSELCIQGLPTEMMWTIFRKLNGSDLVRIRKVCQWWKFIVDSCQNAWRGACAQEFEEIYMEAYNRAGLPWRHLYQSLSLWPRVPSANIEVQSSGISACKFQLLHNYTLACPDVSDTYAGEDYNSFDTIIYYDLLCLSEEIREVVDFPFRLYKENNNIILLVNKEKIICVILKENKKKFIIGKLTRRHGLTSSNCRILVLLEKDVCFVNDENELCLSSIVKDNDEFKMNTTKLLVFYGSILAAVRIKNTKVNILCDNGHMYMHFFADGKLEDRLLSGYGQDRISQLVEHGFKWSTPVIYNYLKVSFRHAVEFPKILRSYKSISCSYGDIIIINSSRGYIDIFKTYLCDSDEDETSSSDESFMNYNCFIKPVKYDAIKLMSIDFLKLISKSPPLRKKISQIDVVETVRGHKLVVLYDHKIYVINLTHGTLRKRKNSNQEGSSKKKTKN